MRANREHLREFIHFDWKGLSRRPLEPLGSYPKECPGGEIQLADGRDISIRQLHQHYIYAGHMLGAMSPPEEEVLRVIDLAQQRYPWMKQAIAVFPPELLVYSPPRMPLMLAQPEQDLGPVTLPRVAVIAELQSFSPARDATECYSSLIAIWFQDRFGDPPNEVLSQISSLDWNALAFDWTP